MQRYLVIYYNGDENTATLIDDADMRFPFGVEPAMVSDDCVDIHAIVEVADDTTVPLVVMDDKEVVFEEQTNP